MSSTLGSGMAKSRCLMRKYPGVNASKSFGSVDSGSRGHEFNIPSMRVNNVVNSSEVYT